MTNLASNKPKLIPASVLAEPKGLSPDAKKQIKMLSGARPFKFLSTAALVWLTIIATIFVAEYINNILFTIFALYIIASRQIMLGFLMHDQAHQIGFKHKLGDLYANMLVAYPLLFMSVEKYAQVHLTHHQHYFSDKDPDFHRKNGNEWAQMTKKELFTLFLKDFFAINVIKLIKGKKMQTKPFKRKWNIPKYVFPVYLLIIAILLTAFGGWYYFLLYWLLPLISFMQVLVRFGALCEHRYNIKDSNLRETTATIILPWWQQLLIPNLNFNYHVYHHLYPGVSFSNLPKVHDIFVKEGLVDEGKIFHGYGSYYKQVVLSN